MKKLQAANPLITGSRDIKLGPPSSTDGYRPVYETKNGKPKRLGHVGNAAGLRWLLAYSK